MDQKAQRIFGAIGLAVAALGLGVSVYTVAHHIQVHQFGFTDFACNINAQFNCDQIALSPYAELFGIPLGVFGAGFFIGMAILSYLIGFREENAHDSLQAYAVMSLLGVVSSLALGVISVTQVGSLCIACIGIYILTLVQLGLVAAMRHLIPWPITFKALSNASSAPIFAVIVAIAGYNFYPREPARQKPAALSTTQIQELQEQQGLEIPIARSAYSGLGEDFRKGPDSAKVTIVEFADLQCPACSHVHAALQNIAKEFDQDVQIVFRNFPLDPSCNSSVRNKIHEYACEAAVLARCVGEKGHFWPYLSQVYSNQASMKSETLRSWAAATGVPAAELDYCMSSRKAEMEAKIKDDIALGQRLNVEGTPTLFINGRRYLGSYTTEDIGNHLRQVYRL